MESPRWSDERLPGAFSVGRCHTGVIKEQMWSCFWIRQLFPKMWKIIYIL